MVSVSDLLDAMESRPQLGSLDATSIRTSSIRCSNRCTSLFMVAQISRVAADVDILTAGFQAT